MTRESQPPVPPLSKLAVDTATAAELLGVSERYLADCRWRGNGPPFFRVRGSKRGRILYRVAALEAWAVAREQTSTAAKVGAA
jgi:hypothetical protein